MSYGDNELKAAASELVQGTVSFKRDVLGPRDARSSFDEVRELVNSTLLYEPDSVFYLIFIASQALQKIVNDEVGTLAELLDAVDDLLKPNKPIEDVGSVAEASVALAALDGAIARSGRIGQTEYSRYLKAIGRAKRTFGSVTKLTFTPRGSSQAITDIVRPAAQARKDTTAHFDTLKTQHAVMLERVSNLLTAYRSFNLDELATLVSRTQVSRAQSQMNGLYEQLKDLPPAERTELARGALLKVLTNRSVVTAMTSAPTPGGVKLEQRKGAAAAYRLVASGTGSAPILEGVVSAPYPLELDAAQNLTLTLNDVLPDLDVDLLPVGGSFLDGITEAQLKGSRSGPFQIAADIPFPLVIHSREIAPAGTFGLTTTSNRFHTIVDGVSYEVTLPTGAGSTVAAVASAIDAAVPTITATEVAGSTPTFTRVQIIYSNGLPPMRYSERHMHVLEGALNAVLGPYQVGGVTPPFGSTPGYTAFSSGWDDNTELKVKPNDDIGEETINLTVGTWTGDPATSYLRIATQIETDINGQASGFTASLADQLLVLTSTLKGEGSVLTIVSDGMYSGAPKPDTGTPSFKGAETLGFYEGQEDRQRDVDGRVIINLLNEDTTFAAEARAKLAYTELTRQRRATTHVLLNHCIEYNVEVNPTADWPPVGELKLQVLTGDNSGVYQIGGWSWSAGTLLLQLSRNLRHQDTAIFHEIVVYREVIQIASLDSSVDGLLEAKDSVTDPARAALGLPTGAVRGGVSKTYIEYNDPQVGWVPADLRQRLLKIGDQLKRLDTNADVTKVTSVVEAASGLLTISPQVDPLLSLDTTQGFNIQSISYLNYAAFETLLTTWWDNISPFGDEDLEYLDRLLSPVLLVSATAPRVNAVYAAVGDLRGKLTGAGSLLEILQSFSVTKIFPIDQALQSLLEQGHNRARALLIKGDIAAYMETTKEDSSFGKAVMKATSAVAIQDVNEPTNLNRHLSEDHERVVAEWYDDKDPLHDFSDVEGDLDEPAALDFWEGID